MIGLLLRWPSYWPLLFGLPLLLVACWWQRRRHERELLRVLGGRHAALVGVAFAPRLRAAMATLATLVLGFAMLQPVAAGEVRDVETDVVLCLDLSGSMAARDVVPSRWHQAAPAVAGLLVAADAARIAVLAYAGASELVVPATRDGVAVRWLVDDLTPGTLAVAGTDPGAAIDHAVRLLQRGERGVGEIVVLSDGEDFVGGATAAAARAQAAGCRVHALGFGTAAGSKIVVPGPSGETFVQDAAGVDVVSQLDAGALLAWAAAGGGVALVPAGPDSLATLYQAELAPAALAAAVRQGRVQPVPWHTPALLVALLLWMLVACLPERRR
jgi:Ca-activated chloride channel family protein